MKVLRLTMKSLRRGRFQPQKDGVPFGESGTRPEILRQLYEIASGHDVVVVHHETSRSPKRRKPK